MALELIMGDDGILRTRISGEMDKITVDQFQREIEPFLEAATQDKPLNNILFPENLGRISYEVRRYFTGLNHNPRYGMVAIINPPRPIRVLSNFILKATRRENINFFDDEEQALSWIKNGT